MSGFNKVVLLGHVGGAPVSRRTSDGTPVTNFTLATTERWSDSTGEKHERTEWHRIVTWSRLAEVAEKHVGKGTQLLVEGRLRTRQWQDKDSVQRSATEIHAYKMLMVGRPRQESVGEPPAEVAAVAPEPVPASVGPAGDDEDLPF